MTTIGDSFSEQITTDQQPPTNPSPRYGKRIKKEKDYFKTNALSRYFDHYYTLKANIEKFNQSESLGEKQLLLFDLTQRNYLNFKKYGSVPTDEYATRLNALQTYETPPKHLLHIINFELEIRKLHCSKRMEYIIFETIPLENIFLQIRGHSFSNFQKSNLEIHAIMPQEIHLPVWIWAIIDQFK